MARGRDRARIVQVSDTHWSAADGVPPQWAPTLAWLEADPPDLVVHSGDIVYEDPDNEADRELARTLLASVPGDVVVIPGNHDVGMYGDPADDLARRIEAFCRAWGDDRFVRDLAGWRIVGIDAYRLGDPAHDDWFRSAIAVDAPVMVFVHQPVRGDRDDEWRMADSARAAFEDVIADADVRVIASGHRHRSHRNGRAVWAPSMTILGTGSDVVGDPRLGVLEHTIGADGSHDVRVVRPWEVSS